MKKRVHKPYRYEGVHEDLGRIFSWNKSSCTPRLTFNSRNREAFCGYDPERNRFVVEPSNRKGLRFIGWRKDVYYR